MATPTATRDASEGTTERVEVPLSLQLGDDLAAANYGFFNDREQCAAVGLRLQRHRRAGRHAQASAARLDGRRRITFAAWQRNVRDGIVARAQILRVQERRRCRTLLRHQVRAWAAATVGARALHDVEQARATLAEQEATHARMVQQVVMNQEARDAAERRRIYQRGILRGSEISDAAWERKLEATREQDAHAAFLQLQNVQDAHAIQLLTAVEDARAEVQATTAVDLRRKFATTAAAVVVSEAVASVESQLLHAVEKNSASRLSSRAERRLCAAFYMWLLVVDKGQIGRLHATRLSVKCGRRRTLRFALPLWCQFLDRARSRRAAIARADGFKRRQCLSKAKRCFVELAAYVRTRATLYRRGLRLETLRYQRYLLMTFVSWHRRATLSVRVLEMSLRAKQQIVSRLLGFVLHQWVDMTQRSLMKFAQDWRRQRLLAAFTRWSVTVDDAVSTRIGIRLQEIPDLYRVAGLISERGGGRQIGILGSADVDIYPNLEDCNVVESTQMRMEYQQQKLLQLTQEQEQADEQHRQAVQVDSGSDCDSESCASNSSFASCSSFVSCASSARSLVGARSSLANITNRHRAGATLL